MSIKIQHLTLTRNSRRILEDVSAVFDKEKLHFLVGKNGSGKSSLLKCLAGIEPESQFVEINGKSLSLFAAKERAKILAWVSQQHQIDFAMTAWDYILMGRFPYLSWLGNWQQEDKKVVEKYIKLLDIEDITQQNIQTLSGGEFQKVCLARALAQETAILLLDEPAQSLDPHNKKWLYHFLPTLVENGKTIICVSHDIEYLPSSAIIWGMAKGKIVWQGANEKAMWEKVFEEN